MYRKGILNWVPLFYPRQTLKLPIQSLQLNSSLTVEMNFFVLFNFLQQLFSVAKAKCELQMFFYVSKSAVTNVFCPQAEQQVQTPTSIKGKVNAV